MNCSACGTASRAGAKFCQECGAPLEQRCPSCGAAVTGEQKFCAECGSRLPAADAVRVEPARAESARFAAPSGYTPAHLAERILKDRAVLTGERKQVTVLFADVSGFTRLAERLDPEDVHALMNRAFELMLAEIHRYEGTVNLMEILRQVFAIADADSEAQVIEKVTRTLQDLGEPAAAFAPYIRFALSVDPGDPLLAQMDPTERLEERYYAGSSRWLLGEVARRRGDREAAGQSYRAGLAIAEELGAKPLADRCRAALSALG